MVQLPTSPCYAAIERRFMKAGQWPCAVCGKGLDPDSHKLWLHVHGGGSTVVTDEEAATLDPGADMGGQPVGADCVRRHPELKPYVMRRGT